MDENELAEGFLLGPHFAPLQPGSKIFKALNHMFVSMHLMFFHCHRVVISKSLYTQ